MKIQTISPNYTNYKINNTSKTNTTQQVTYKNIPLSNAYYKPFFGSGNHYNSSIQDFLNNENYNDNIKDKLKNLLKIKHFKTAAMAMKEEDIANFVENSMFFEPVFEDLLKGKYVAIFENSEIEKPIFDLESIAKYNKKHIEKPKNLNQEFEENWLAINFLAQMKIRKLDKLSKPIQFPIMINGETIVTTIKYKPSAKTDYNKLNLKISKKEFERIKNAAPETELKKLLESNSLDNAKKKTLWELTQIPFFNAAVNNLSEEEIKDIVDYVELNKAFLTEMLKGNITIKDTATKEDKPLLDMPKIAINNQVNPNNQISLYDEFLTNDLFSNIMNRCRLEKSLKGQYPLFFTAHDQTGKILGAPTKIKTIEEAKQAIEFIQNNEKLHKIFPYVIVFENDLNQVEKELHIGEKSLTKAEQEKLFNAKLAPTPKSFMNYLQNPDHSQSEKKIAYNLSEKPYINELMKNSKECDVADLVFLKQTYSKTLNDIFSGKTKIVEANNEYQAKPLINLEEMVLKGTELNEVMSFGTFAYDLCKEIGNSKKEIGKNLAKISYQKLFDGAAITAQTIDGELKTTYKCKTLPNSIKEYLNKDPNNQKFSLYLGIQEE